jgi:hypothetical protein
MNPKTGHVNSRIGVYFQHELCREYCRITIELQTPFTYQEAKEKAAKKLKVKVEDIQRITFN